MVGLGQGQSQELQTQSRFPMWWRVFKYLLLLAGSWNFKQSQNLNPGTLTQDLGNPTGFVSTRLNTHPKYPLSRTFVDFLVCLLKLSPILYNLAGTNQSYSSFPHLGVLPLQVQTLSISAYESTCQNSTLNEPSYRFSSGLNLAGGKAFGAAGVPAGLHRPSVLTSSALSQGFSFLAPWTTVLNLSSGLTQAFKDESSNCINEDNSFWNLLFAIA